MKPGRLRRRRADGLSVLSTLAGCFVVLSVAAVSAMLALGMIKIFTMLLERG